MDRLERRVVCAAIRASDGEVLFGVRHYSKDMHKQIESRFDGKKFIRRGDADQGFVDQYGCFMSREEAWLVAEKSGQLRYPESCGEGLTGFKLYSEDLY